MQADLCSLYVVHEIDSKRSTKLTVLFQNKIDEKKNFANGQLEKKSLQQDHQNDNDSFVYAGKLLCGFHRKQQHLCD